MRLQACEHAEAVALARRLRCSDAGTAADDRRALLLFWYGTGATRLQAEDDALLATWERDGGADHPPADAIRAERARISDEAAAIAADGRTSPVRLRDFGDALAAHLAKSRRLVRQ